MRSWFPLVLFVSTGLAVTLVLVIVASQFFYAGPIEPLRALLEKDVQSAILLSLFTASVATTVGLIVAVPSAYFLARYQTWAKVIIDAILDVPVILSPIALGTALLLFFRTDPGRWIEMHVIRFVFEIPGIILAQFFLPLLCLFGFLRRASSRLMSALSRSPGSWVAASGRLFQE